MKRAITIFLLSVLCITLFAGCNNTPKTLYQSKSVIITREGVKTTVSDLLSGNEYIYTTKKVKRTEAPVEARTSIDTDTIKIEVIPSGLRVYDKAEEKAVEITHQRGRIT